MTTKLLSLIFKMYLNKLKIGADRLPCTAAPDSDIVPLILLVNKRKRWAVPVVNRSKKCPVSAISGRRKCLVLMVKERKNGWHQRSEKEKMPCVGGQGQEKMASIKGQWERKKCLEMVVNKSVCAPIHWWSVRVPPYIGGHCLYPLTMVLSVCAPLLPLFCTIYG